MRPVSPDARDPRDAGTLRARRPGRTAGPLKRLLLLGAALLAASGAAFGQEYPNRPIRWIVPFAAGGPADVIARTIQPELSRALGQPVVIDNKGGGNNNIGHADAARAAPDGYTLLYVVPSVVTNPSLYPNMVDPVKELVPVTRLTSQAYVLVANNDFPAKTLGEALALAKTKPGGVTCASGGGLMTFGCEWLKSATRLDLVHVRYKGNGPAMNDLLGGQVNLLFDLFNSSLPQVRAGRIRPIALTGSKRGEPLPQLPVVGETVPGFVLEGWHGVMVPAGVPRAVVERLNKAFHAALADPAVIRRITDGFSEVAPTTPERFGEILREDLSKYAKIVEASGMKGE